mmetsp:Transcript_1072/g.2494  ORF Transcript_1072/g.2494 Transcript_1072/m.2494 type:complete len:103 (-) Transcript_1072:138-446(-)
MNQSIIYERVIEGKIESAYLFQLCASVSPLVAVENVQEWNDRQQFNDRCSQLDCGCLFFLLDYATGTITAIYPRHPKCVGTSLRPMMVAMILRQNQRIDFSR